MVDWKAVGSWSKDQVQAVKSELKNAGSEVKPEVKSEVKAAKAAISDLREGWKS